ncbi:MAG: endosialidase [Firmicutes bacterium]|nr:endosialidase [Bacillota bacterium]
MIIEEGIIKEQDGSLSFGDYKRAEKLKVENFEVDGNMYKVRTHDQVTRLSKNSNLLLETVPGASVHNFKADSKITTFSVEGKGSTQITLELEANTLYAIYADDVEIDQMKSNLSGKISFSADLSEKAQDIIIKKI